MSTHNKQHDCAHFSSKTHTAIEMDIEGSEHAEVVNAAIQTLNALLDAFDRDGAKTYLTLLTAYEIFHMTSNAGRRVILESEMRRVLVALYAAEPFKRPHRPHVNDVIKLQTNSMYGKLAPDDNVSATDSDKSR